MIGIVGLGAMGRAIAERLVDQGERVAAWNRSASKFEGLDGVDAVATPAALAGKADVVLSILADDAAAEAVYFGEGGLVSSDLGGTVIVEMCTMAPDRAKALATAVEARGGRFLECPVGGTVGPARAGELLGLAGGSDAAFRAAEPVLARLTRRLEHLGPVGTGSAMKLAINLPLMVYWAALGEALGLAMSHGVSPDRALDILGDSSGAIRAAKARIPPILDMVVSGTQAAPNFTLRNAIKDMQLMIVEAERAGLPAGVIRAARARAGDADAAGLGGLDASLVACFGLGQHSGPRKD